MYQVSRVQTALSGIVGWRQPSEDFFELTAGNIASTSGMYFSDFSPLCEVANVLDLQENPDINQSQFNTLLTNIVKGAVVKVCNSVFVKQDLCEARLLYENESLWTQTLDNDASFVGFEITPPRGNYLVEINSVKTAFDGIDTVKVLLFHSSKSTPVYTKEITTEALSETETYLGWTLPYNFGKYYFGYLRGALTAKAVDRDWSMSDYPTPYNTIRISPINIAHNAETLFDIEDISYVEDAFGLNPMISTYNDYTVVVEQNRQRFANALGLQVAVDIADLIVKSTRSNFKERNLKAVALMEKEGLISQDPNAPKVNSLVQKLKSELKNLQGLFGEDWRIKKGTL